MRGRTLVVSVLLAITGGCTSQASPTTTGISASVTSPTTSSTASAPPATTSTTHQSVYITVPEFHVDVDLSLEQGEVSTSFPFESPNPATHFFDVLLVFPTDTDLRVFFETAKGGTLQIFKGSTQYSFCAIEEAQMRCLLHFPTLEAQGAGVWTALVRKLSEPAAEIRIEIIWMTEAAP